MELTQDEIDLLEQELLRCAQYHNAHNWRQVLRLLALYHKVVEHNHGSQKAKA